MFMEDARRGVQTFQLFLRLPSQLCWNSLYHGFRLDLKFHLLMLDLVFLSRISLLCSCNLLDRKFGRRRGLSCAFLSFLFKGGMDLAAHSLRDRSVVEYCTIFAEILNTHGQWLDFLLLSCIRLFREWLIITFLVQYLHPLYPLLLPKKVNARPFDVRPTCALSDTQVVVLEAIEFNTIFQDKALLLSLHQITIPANISAESPKEYLFGKIC